MLLSHIVPRDPTMVNSQSGSQRRYMAYLQVVKLHCLLVLVQWFSKVWPLTTSGGSPQELVTNANSLKYPSRLRNGTQQGLLVILAHAGV